MIYKVPFEAAHYDLMRVQAAQEWMQTNVTSSELRGLENPYAATLMEDGCPLVCAGPVIYWPGRALLWSFFSDRVTRRNFMSVHLAAREYLAGLPIKRLEASVNVDFVNGHRWMKALGFVVEAPFQEAFQVDGKDSVGYVRIRR